MKFSLTIPVLMAAIASPVFAAVDVYMAFADGVNGVQNTVFQGDLSSAIISDIKGNKITQKLIEVETVNLGSQQTLNIGSQSTGTGAGKLSFTQMTITRKADVNSPMWFNRMATGRAGSMMLYFVKSAGGSTGASNVAFMTMEFRLVAIASQTFNDSGDGDGPLETLTFQYGATQITAADQSANGQFVNSQNSAWSRVSNTNTINVGNTGTG